MNKKDEAHVMAGALFSDEEFNKELRAEMDSHHEFFNNDDKKHKGFIPTLEMVGVKNADPFGKKHITVAIMPDLGDDKYESLKNVGKKMALELADQTIVAVFMSTEAWMRKTTKDDPTANDGQVHKYDDKKEAIVTTGLAMDARTNMAVQMVERKGDKSITLTDERVIEYNSDSLKVESNLLKQFYIGYTAGYTERVAKKFGKKAPK